ncbi:hypothetical protein HNY73_020153 [Argiope bruennichi]|uniref:Uncharacterized protein n=1 Tax=Argiope bruennichi TaxID=94029 RepID=A0A8T0E8F8_ARGBR|nr:hypothetical protein HNY73_020153 [Argiope bruennichi]
MRQCIHLRFKGFKICAALMIVMNILISQPTAEGLLHYKRSQSSSVNEMLAAGLVVQMLSEDHKPHVVHVIHVPIFVPVYHYH